MNPIFLSLLLFRFLPPLFADISLPDSISSSCKGFTIYSSTSTTSFGYSVDGGGDINNDGIPDILISDYLYPSTTSTLYVIYGTKKSYSDIDVAIMSSSQGFKITGLSLRCDDNANFLSSSGDVDGDGIADIVIGATTADSSNGAAYVIYGKEGGYLDFDISALTGDMGYKISGNGGQFGWNVNSKGDINGDGIADVIVSGSVIDTTYGGAYIIYGQKTRGSGVSVASMTTDQGFKLSGYKAYYSGAAISSAGDFNGDGIMDFSITAPGASSDVGSAFVIYGQNGTFTPFSLFGMSTDQGFSIQGVSPIHYLALVASEAGDFNGDGVSDLLLGAYKSTASDPKGIVYVLYGKEGGPTDFLTTAMEATQGFTISGVNTNDYLGSALAGIDDVNGDGIDDIIIGAKGFSSSQGSMYVIYGREDQPSEIDLSEVTIEKGFQITSAVSAGLLGSSVRNLGDINQDGVSDMILGVPGAGKAYVLFGPNAWACDICKSSSKCKTCETGYNYTYNGLCFIECPVYAPYKVGSECFSEDPTEEGIISAGLKNSLSKGAASTTAANKVTNLWSPADALPFIYGQLKASIMYMRYLNISRSEKLEELYQLYYDSDTNIIPWISMPDSVKGLFPGENLPYMFEKYNLPSRFIANFGDDGMCLVVVMVGLIVSQLVYSLMKKWLRNFTRFKLILRRISITLQNFLIGSLGESMGSVTFYAILEFKNQWNNDKGYYISSPLGCIVALLVGILILMMNILILLKFQKARKSGLHKKEASFKAIEKKYEGIAVLFQEFNDASFLQQSAFLLFNFRTIFESLIVGLLFESPMAQAVLLIIMNLALFIYLVYKRPFESVIDLIQQLVLLSLIFICDPCLVIMTQNDADSEIIEKTSNIIFYTLVIFQFVPLFFFALKLMESAWGLWKWFKLNESISKKKNHIAIKNERPSQIENNQSSMFTLDCTTLNINQTNETLPDRKSPPRNQFNQFNQFNYFGIEQERFISPNKNRLMRKKKSQKPPPFTENHFSINDKNTLPKEKMRRKRRKKAREGVQKPFTHFNNDQLPQPEIIRRFKRPPIPQNTLGIIQQEGVRGLERPFPNMNNGNISQQERRIRDQNPSFNFNLENFLALQEERRRRSRKPHNNGFHQRERNIQIPPLNLNIDNKFQQEVRRRSQSPSRKFPK